MAADTKCSRQIIDNRKRNMWSKRTRTILRYDRCWHAQVWILLAVNHNNRYIRHGNKYNPKFWHLSFFVLVVRFYSFLFLILYSLLFAHPSKIQIYSGRVHHIVEFVMQTVRILINDITSNMQLMERIDIGKVLLCSTVNNLNM